jgi:vacuolar-type H+-ATPase subunit D/Vma8
MIDKLFNLKKSQTDQKLMQKAQIDSSISNLNDEIMATQQNIDTSSVDRFGAISDFTILQMHKNTMKLHIKKLENQRQLLFVKLDKVQKEVIELQKETEQYGYILEEERKEAIKKLLVAEEEASSEYMQSKYITG